MAKDHYFNISKDWNLRTDDVIMLYTKINSMFQNTQLGAKGALKINEVLKNYLDNHYAFRLDLIQVDTLGNHTHNIPNQTPRLANIDVLVTPFEKELSITLSDISFHGEAYRLFEKDKKRYDQIPNFNWEEHEIYFHSAYICKNNEFTNKSLDVTEYFLRMEDKDPTHVVINQKL